MTRPSNNLPDGRIELGAFAAIVLYGIVYGVGEVLSARTALPYLISPALMTAYLVVLYAVISKAGLRSWCALQAPLPMPRLATVCMALLAVVPIEQLLYGAFFGGSLEGDMRRFLLLVVGAVVEEIFFRGFLLSWLTDRRGMSIGASVLIGAVLFALLHCANALNMLISELIMVLPFSLFAGVAFGFLRMKSDSVGWCIVLHMLINAASSLVVPHDYQLVQIAFAAVAAVVMAFVVLRPKAKPSVG